MDKQIIDSLKSRYAVKKFDPTKKLTEKQLENVLEATRLTATSYGLQLMKVVLVNDKDTREKLVDCSFGQRQVADASHLLVLCRERDFDLDHIEDYVQNIADTRKVEADSLSGFKNGMAKLLTKRKEDQVSWMDKQVYIALGNLITTCAIMGIGACPMEGFIPDEYDEILDLKSQNLASVLVLPIGFPAEDDPGAKRAKVRRPIEKFVIEK
ncbi:NAD(P)H-dependent oxidoreductase [Paracrocinitomix mangrovi]|uniref:NAD(P)H-dependent oxidoreductase n=1 Tax=Paracrocinitomix mangrovi TaxID=2862509 RepID=UPI001C8E8D1B|nr:NAD(P)H-dependent oxidoreductase [Paracrocinitomix mangrovi]UKN00794.1 NAD(P)H-dependent oxidoreductase [Paracrocinitomix mangrovi]